MAETTTVVAKKRDERGTRAARRLRRQGWLPGVIYGHGEATTPLVVETDALRAVIRHGVRVVDVQCDGTTEKCLIREVQWDALGKDLVHVDFTRVRLDERIRVTVPIQIRGTAAGVTAGGVLDQPLHTVEIECLAVNVPDAVRVNVHELQIEQAIHLRELVVPEGVKVLGDPETVVVQVAKPAEAAETTAAEVPEGPVEPEVIGRKAGEEEAGAE
jgi:large subunit ribosomal protein L25